MLWWTLRGLKSKNMLKQKEAARKLGQLRDCRAVEPLLTALKGADVEAKVCVVNALGEIGDIRAVNPLLEMLRVKETSVRQAVEGALVKLGEHHRSLLKPKLNEAILRAAKRGDADSVVLLLRVGADSNVKQGDADSVVQRLMRVGADSNAKHQNGNTALIYTAGNGQAIAVHALLEAGADINAPGEHGNTALMSAVQGEHEEVVKLLVEAGADISMKSEYGETALICAAEKGNRAILDVLIGAGSDLNKELFMAVEQGRVGWVQSLVEVGADVNTQSESGNTALICAIRKGYVDIAKHLIEAGANVNAKDRYGINPLIYATQIKLQKEKAIKEIGLVLVGVKMAGFLALGRDYQPINGLLSVEERSEREELERVEKRGTDKVVQILSDRWAGANANQDDAELAAFAALGMDPNTNPRLTIREWIESDPLSRLSRRYENIAILGGVAARWATTE